MGQTGPLCLSGQFLVGQCPPTHLGWLLPCGRRAALAPTQQGSDGACLALTKHSQGKRDAYGPHTVRASQHLHREVEASAHLTLVLSSQSPGSVASLLLHVLPGPSSLLPHPLLYPFFWWVGLGRLGTGQRDCLFLPASFAEGKATWKGQALSQGLIPPQDIAAHGSQFPALVVWGHAKDSNKFYWVP